MATSPTLLRQSPRTHTRTCLTLKPTATTKNDRSQTPSCSFPMNILKPDVANSLIVHREREETVAAPFKSPNSHRHAAHVPVSTPNHGEGGRKGLHHQCIANPNLLLNLKAAVARKGYVQRHIGAPIPNLEGIGKQGRKTSRSLKRPGLERTLHCTVRKQPTRLIDCQKDAQGVLSPNLDRGCQRVAPHACRVSFS